MDIKTNIPLKDLTTMRIGGNARFMAEAHSKEDVANIHRNAKKQGLKIYVIGGGSNIIAHDEGFNGIIIKMSIPGFEIIKDGTDQSVLKIGAGENWDSIVKKTVEMGLSGIEAMSYIPGTIGATPVQNVGAYGQEIADVIESVELYDSVLDSFVVFNNLDCKFSYRDSIFRNEANGRYVIVYITIKLSKKQPQPPFYKTLQEYFDKNNINVYSSKIIREAVIEIRKNKLPNPNDLPNTGSFFKNAMINEEMLSELRNKYPDMPAYKVKDGEYKIPTGWLIEQAGLKGQLFHGFRIFDKNALVLVNESGNSYENLSLARQEIIQKIYETFKIKIEQEPLEITP